MRAALLHLDLYGGPEEANLKLIQYSMQLAANEGVKWVVTPETAVQGYFFATKNADAKITVQPTESINPIRQMAAKYGLTVFLCCAELDEKTGFCFNSCLIIGDKGEIVGRHRKMHSHGSGAEGWASKGNTLNTFICREMTAGVLICADSYYEKNAQILRTKEAEVIIVPAAWPPGGCGGPPVNSWERCSRESGLPVWICNQTGNKEKMDMTNAQSAIVVNGKLQIAYQSLQQAVLVFDWNTQKKKLISSEFQVLTL